MRPANSSSLGMFLLDENISELEALRLRRAGVRVRRISEVVRIGTSDADIVRALRRLKRPLLFSQDEHFFQLKWLHAQYGLAYFDTSPTEIAEFARRFLGHPEFNTQAKRMGLVARLSSSGVSFWRAGDTQLRKINWP